MRSRAALGLLLGAWAAAAAPDGSQAPTTSSGLVAALNAAELAYGSTDVDTFRGQVGVAEADVTCLGEAITPALAARAHRVIGLGAFVDQDSDQARQAFAAARSLDPDYRFPSPVVPDDPRYAGWTAYDAIPLSVKATEPLPAPRKGKVLLDGREETNQPTPWPALFQHENAKGEIVANRYLWPGDGGGDFHQDTLLPRFRVGIGLMGAGGAELATAGVLALVGPKLVGVIGGW